MRVNVEAVRVVSRSEEGGGGGWRGGGMVGGREGRGGGSNLYSRRDGECGGLLSLVMVSHLD
jgi:hypothetical protein